MSQLSFFGSETAATDGLFLAVLPEDHAVRRIQAVAGGLRTQHGLQGKLIRADRYHVSLFSFGEYHGLPRGLVPKVIKAAAAIDMAPFDLVFDRAMSFGGGQRRTLVLCGSDGVAKLMAFHRIVSAGMQTFRAGRAKSQFVPHLILLYDERGIEEQSVERIGWTVTDFVLVHSLLGRGQYNILGRWPLRADGVRLH